MGEFMSDFISDLLEWLQRNRIEKNTAITLDEVKELGSANEDLMVVLEIMYDGISKNKKKIEELNIKLDRIEALLLEINKAK